LLQRKGCGQNCGEDQAGEFEGPLGLHPAHVPKEQDRPDCYRRKDEYARLTKKHPHSGDIGGACDKWIHCQSPSKVRTS
jgi:hypothetical protein